MQPFGHLHAASPALWSAMPGTTDARMIQEALGRVRALRRRGATPELETWLASFEATLVRASLAGKPMCAGNRRALQRITRRLDEF
jgi:hypothetical protein